MDCKKAAGVVVILAIVLFGCYIYLPENDKAPSISGDVTGVDPTYGDLILDFTTDDMFEKGFHYGDYIRVKVAGYELKSVVLVESANCSPYFSYFVANNGGRAAISMFNGFMFSADIGTEVVMTYEGKCDGYQHMTNLKRYVTDESRYSDTKDYANFYEITGGDIASGRVYRSYSMIKDSDVPSRSWYVDKFAEECGIGYMLMLSYSEAQVEAAPEWFKGTYGQELVDSGRYTALQMHPADIFCTPEKVRAVFDAMIENDGPYLIYCNLGKDRTGMVSILIQGLCGASNEEIRDSYMKAFENLYLIEKDSDSYKAVQQLTYDRSIYMLAHPELGDKPYLVDWSQADSSGIDAASTAVAYLKGTVGLTDEELSLLREKLTTPVPTESYMGADAEMAAA